MMRTNYFRARRATAAPQAVRCRSSSTRRSCRCCRAPRPRFEIFVYSPRVEGVHLRGGRVARGGLRWSDRREDFRTEVLGLMKAQMVKNAVIVPVGAKGGFVVKRPPRGGGREALQRGGHRLLPDVPRGPARPHRQHRRRRGRRRPRGSSATTATTPIWSSPPTRAPRRFSDIANEVSAAVRLLARRRVRLRRLARLRPQGDGDHRARRVGVGQAPLPRARHRHPERPTSRSSGSATCPATCSATGCCSRAHIRLVAAFNHLHVFLDPDPDPEASFAERAAAVRAAALVLERLRPGADLRGRRRLSAHARSRSRSRRRSGAALGIDAPSCCARRADPRDPARARRPALERRHRHLRQGRAPRRTPTSATRPTTRVRVDGARAALPGRRRGRQPRLHPARADRVRARAAARDQHRRDRQRRAASTAPTTRSTSRSCSTRWSPTAS